MAVRKTAEGRWHFNELERFSLHKRKCRTFVEFDGNEDDAKRHPKEVMQRKHCCICGCEEEKHLPKKHETSSERWNIVDDTKLEHITENDCGPMKLTNDKPIFVRCDIQTKPERIANILQNVWNIKPPRLLLCVIGGAKYFKMSDYLEEKFCHAIIHATQQSNAWLLTNGLDVGITHLVGQALDKFCLTHREKDIAAIAVVKFGCITNYQHLKDLANRVSPSDTQHDSQTLHNMRLKGEQNLELHHTHYILLDDGTVRNYKGIEDRLSAIAKAVSCDQVPAVTLVVEGGFDTITSMYHSLRFGIPIILIKGSGRIADFFVRWLQSTKSEIENHKDKDWKNVYDIRECDNTYTNKSPKTPPKNDATNAHKELTGTARINLDINKIMLEKLFKSKTEKMENDLRRTLSHHNEESWQKDDSVKLDGIVKKARLKVWYCLQPAVRSSIFTFDLNGDNNLTDTILNCVYESRKKKLIQADAHRCEEHDRQIKRTTGSDEQDIKIEETTTQPTTDSAARMKKTKELNQKANELYSEDRVNLNRQILNLALEWNCLETARDLVIRNSIVNIGDPKRFIWETLSRNLPNFLQYFITLNVSFTQLFQSGEVQNHNIAMKNSNATIYNKTFIPNLYSSHLIKKAHKENNSLLKVLIEKDKYLKSKQGVLSTNKLNYILKELTEQIIANDIYPEQKKANDHPRTNKVSDEENRANNPYQDDLTTNIIFRDLFIWMILMNYIDMAKVLLAHMNHRICAALFARKILKSIRDKYAVYGDKKEKYTQTMDYFEKYAIDCLMLCYENDSYKSCELVLRQIDMFGNVTCLQMAISADAKRFVSQPCCVQTMRNIWYGTIDKDRSKWSRLGLAVATFGLTTMCSTIEFRDPMDEDELHAKKNDENFENRLEPHGITYSNDRIQQCIPPFPSEKPVNTAILNFVQFHQSLFAKFSYALFHYVFVLLLFSYVVLFKFDPLTEEKPSIHWTEILLIILIFFMLISDIRSHFESDDVSGTNFQIIVFFKWLVRASYFLFTVGFILRFVLKEPDGNFFWARIVMGYALQLWWFRALDYLNAAFFFGPHLAAMVNMLQDLLFFGCVIAIVMLGYGTTSRSIAYYANNSFTLKGIFHDIVYPAYYLMYSQFGDETAHLDAAEGKNWAIATHILLAFNLMLIVVLAINVLIALLNKRFDKIHNEAKEIWHYEQYMIVRKYFLRSHLAPPFCTIDDIIKLWHILYQQIRKKTKHRTHYQAREFSM